MLNNMANMRAGQETNVVFTVYASNIFAYHSCSMNDDKKIQKNRKTKRSSRSGTFDVYYRLLSYMAYRFFVVASRLRYILLAHTIRLCDDERFRLYKDTIRLCDDERFRLYKE